jgi:hypothetical protein
MGFVGVGGGHVGEDVEVVMEGIDLLLDRGEVNRNSNMDIGHLCSNFANGIEDDVVVMVREGGGKGLDRRVDEEAREDEKGKYGRSKEKMGSDHLSRMRRSYWFRERGRPGPRRDGRLAAGRGCE